MIMIYYYHFSEKIGFDISHELADDSHELSSLIVLKKT